MSVEVIIPQFLQHLTDNVNTINVDGETVGKCLEKLVKRFPRLEEILYDVEGNLPHLLNVYVNKESAFPEELDRPVREGDTIHIAYTLVGG